MQAKDIDTDTILRFLAQHQGKWCTHYDGHSMPTVQDAMPPGTLRKVQHAKMRGMLKSGLVKGCGYGCRGDWEITDKGLAKIDEVRTSPMVGEPAEVYWVPKFDKVLPRTIFSVTHIRSEEK